MKIIISKTKATSGQKAAQKAADLILEAIEANSKANIVLATGASQFEFYTNLCSHDEVDWSKVTIFHLDEYIGISASHPASFRYYLTKNFVEKTHPGKVNFIKGDSNDPIKECKTINKMISKTVIDVACVGIGENGHLAFNDPPADFETVQPYIIVELDEQCRTQQVGEGWFESIEEVPKKAISMSIREILRAINIICTCPEKRKATAVKNCLSKEAEISPQNPASILKTHESTFCYLDEDSASLL